MAVSPMYRGIFRATPGRYKRCFNCERNATKKLTEYRTQYLYCDRCYKNANKRRKARKDQNRNRDGPRWDH